MNENKFTTLEQSKRLAKVFGDKAPEADDLWATGNDYKELVSNIPNWDTLKEMINFDYYKAYRLDTLQLELPEWLRGLEVDDFCMRVNHMPDVSKKVEDKIFELVETIIGWLAGKEAIAATVSLLELLKSEGLNE